MYGLAKRNNLLVILVRLTKLFFVKRGEGKTMQWTRMTILAPEIACHVK